MTAAKPATPYTSGFCGVRAHERCRGQYAGCTCSCACHAAPQALQDPEPEPEPAAVLETVVSRRPRLLDLFCGAGGAGVGYHRAGFDVVGVDLEPHADYPFEIIVGNAIDVDEDGRIIGGVLADPAFLEGFDVVHASPPCPRYSVATPEEHRGSHPDLVGPVREALRAWGGTYVIENVPGAPLDHPVMLCGSAFGLRVRRHRLFESNAFLMSPGCFHAAQGTPVGVYGDHADRVAPLRPDGTSRGAKATSVADAQRAMGISWMSRWDDLADAIPPAMTEHLGWQLLDQLNRERAA